MPHSAKLLPRAPMPPEPYYADDLVTLYCGDNAADLSHFARGSDL
jgi:hypothetical protein